MTDRTGATDLSVPILDRVEDAFFALDTDWRFTYINDRAESMLKRSRRRLVGRVMWDEFPETVETQFPEGFHRAMETQEPVSFEVYHHPLDTWFEARAYPSYTGLSVYLRDITDRKSRENELAQHARVVEAVHDGVLTIDDDNRIASVNEAIEETLGATREAVVGEPIRRLPELASLDSQGAMAIGEAMGKLQAGDTAHQRFELTFVDAEGDERIGEMRMVPLGQGQASVAGVLRDVTEQREYERTVDSLHEVTRWLFQAEDAAEICSVAVHAASELLDLPLTGVWLLDDERGVLDPTAATMGAHSELGGLPQFYEGEGLVWDVYRDGEPTVFDDLHQEADRYNENSPLRSEIIVPIGTHGVLMTGSTVVDGFDDTDVELVSLLASNTEAALDRADREKMLQDRNKSLARQSERLRAVADILSEDLQEHLDSVATEVETGDEEAADVTETLTRAEELVDDVLEFARDQTAMGSRSSVDFEGALSDALDASIAEDMTVYLEFEARVRAERDRFVHMLETVFNDVTTRADDASATVRIGLVEDDATSRPTGFYILDDAEAIPETQFDRVFEPATTSGGEKSGLGLAVAREIAEAHGWSVDVSTGQAGGTQFSITGMVTFEVVRA
ncbi:PAS domain-containing protein [Haloarchaeobius sp. HRN-SO-5]|uniref:PAS domain-containing sensor histidine kinase n=1 Tax=Haloarchaeobius sp. HRN-SO-5 TaxID=3446118 RepID=UPI003EB718A4